MGETICELCGDIGAQNALVFCTKCLDLAIHRYCLHVIPETLDEFVGWFCVDCEEKYGKPFPSKEPSPVPSAKGRLIPSGKAPLRPLRTNPKKMKHYKSMNDSSLLKLKLDVIREEENSSPVEVTAEKSYGNTLRSHRIQNELAESDKKVHDCPPKAKKSKKLRPKKSNSKKRTLFVRPVGVSPDPEEHKGQHSPFHKLYKDDKEKMVLEGEKLCIDIGDVAIIAPDSRNCENVVLEGENICIPGADVAIRAPDSQIVPVGSCDVPQAIEHLSAQPVIEPINCENVVLEGENICIPGADVAIRAPDSQIVPVGSCDAPQAIEHISAQPVIEPIWRGNFNSFNTETDGYEVYGGLVAHPSSKAGPKVWEEAKLFSESLCLDLVSKESVWPKSFQTSEPSDDNIALYFFAFDKRCIKALDGLVSEMMSRELALRAVVTNAQLLVFPSNELPLKYWRFEGKFYLWGVFVKKKQVDLSVGNGEENIPNNMALESMSPISPLTNISHSGLRWTLPEAGEFKLNVDASFNPETRESAIGGLIRDKDGVWVRGFYMYLRNLDPETAQLFALFHGLDIAWKLDICKLILESDSEKAIEAVTSACSDHPKYHYIEVIRKLMDRKWSCRIKLINREANTCAKRLTREAFNTLTTNELREPPESMLNFLASDLRMVHDVFDSFAALVKGAQQVEATLIHNRMIGERTDRSTNVPNERRGDRKRTWEVANSRGSQSQNQGGKRSFTPSTNFTLRTNNMPRENPRGRRGCFKCGDSQHRLSECPKTQCRACGLFGHFARDCPGAQPRIETNRHQSMLPAPPQQRPVVTPRAQVSSGEGSRGNSAGGNQRSGPQGGQPVQNRVFSLTEEFNLAEPSSV